ncbi:MAG: rhomboid family intramembrane serine protease [Gemmatimonadaceae bacterium]|nr:rhomboid family intramembrane serine protease [Chitinophagaceae bacterium]
MQLTGSVSLLIIIINCVVSWRGFRETDFFARYEFEVEKIMIYKDYKRLVTSLFLHVNWQHLIFNMISLLLFSFALEGFMGSLKFIALFFLSGVGGNLLALLIHRTDGSYSSVGASGAINGIIFASIAVFPQMAIFFIPGWLFGLIFIVYSIYGIRSKKDNIGHEAHLGGALAGMLIATVFYPSIILSNPLPVLLIGLPVIAFIIIIVKNPSLLMVDSFWFKKQQNYTVDDRYNVQKKTSQQEVDRILEKIHRKGMQSLSRKEKEVLKEYSRR